MTATEQANAQWVRYYVGQGFAIIPIHVLINGWCSCGKKPCGDTDDGKVPAGRNAGKHPVQTRWQQEAQWARSEAAVARWWGDPQGLPYSLGIVCGQASGVWILDVDPRNGGFDSLERLEAEQDVLPATRVAQTGSGGKHFFFRVPAGKKYKKGPLHKGYPGLDVQAEGAQAVLAPSTHVSGRRYSWESAPDASMVEAPDWLLSMVESDRGHPGAGLGGAAMDLEQLWAAGIPDGQRNDTLYKVACSMARKFGTRSPIERSMIVSAMEAWNSRCAPPVPDDELRKIVGSAIDFIAHNPNFTLPPGMEAWLSAQAGGAPLSPAVAAAMEPERPSLVGAPLPATPPELREASGAGDGAPSDDAEATAGGDATSPSSPPDGGAGGALPDEDSLGPNGTPGYRSLTDHGNARRLVDYNLDVLRYTAGLGWYFWDEFTWRQDVDRLRVTNFGREIPVHVMGETANYNTSPTGMQAKQALLDWAVKSKAAGAIKRVVELANSDRRVWVPVSVWDSDVATLGVANGVVDLRTGRLIPPDPRQFITKRTAVPFEPRARDTRFSIWLDQVTAADKELQRWLQRWAGYCLTGDVSEEKFAMLYGPPATGKSTFLELVKACAGDYGLSLMAETLTGGSRQSNSQEYFIAEMVGKRVIIVSEVAEGERMKEDMIKRLTGADTMMGRPIMGKPIEFRAVAKLMIGTNNRPRITDNAMWRRVRLVPFEHTPQVIDKTLKPYLLDPNGGLPAFFAWAVEGAVAWFQAGLGTCATIEEATAAYQAAEDEIGIFLREELRAGDGIEVALTDVHAAFRMWQEDRGIQNPWNIGKLHRELDARAEVELEGEGRRAVVKGWAMQPRAVPQGTQNWASLTGRAGL